MHMLDVQDYKSEALAVDMSDVWDQNSEVLTMGISITKQVG